MHIHPLFPLAWLCCCAVTAQAQSADAPKENNYLPELHGTVRAKFEYQPQMHAGRFEVRNARFSLTGKVAPPVSYKAEIDLSDEGSIKMLDAYTRLESANGLQFTIGQMRVPFTIDAHRSPHQQYFANRSFIAKQTGNVRDVGATLAYRTHCIMPVQLEAGLFNGSGLTNQKDYWTKSINYSTKLQLFPAHGFNVTLSYQKAKPEADAISLYNGGAYYHSQNWHVEAEYLLKRYAGHAFADVHAYDAFACYDCRLRHQPVEKISFLARFDSMGDHSDGKRYADGKADRENGCLIINDYRRQRLTGGITLSLAKAFVADIRINFEKYFYRHGAIPKKSERDKVVVEFMTRF